MKIIFVCTGNTCRSPLAESYAKSLYNSKVFESRGIMVVSSDISEHSKNIIDKNGLPRPSTPEQLRKEDIDGNLLLTMTEPHKMYIEQSFPGVNVYTLSEYTTGESKDVSDPFGGTGEDYAAMFKEIKQYLNLLGKGESS